MAQDINPELLARLENYKIYKDVFVRQYGEKKKAQRIAARIRNKEPNIAIGVAGEMKVVSPGELRNIRQRELQDVFGTQQSSQLSQKIKQDKVLGSQRAMAEAEKLKAQIAAQAQVQAQTQVAQSSSVSGVPKKASSLRVGQQKITYKEVRTAEGKLSGFQKMIGNVKSDFLPFDPNVASIPMSPEYLDLFATQKVQTPKGNAAFRVKTGKTVEFEGRSYKGGQFVHPGVAYIDQLRGRILGGTKLTSQERIWMEENLPADFEEKVLASRAKAGIADPNSFANVDMNAMKKQWMMEDAEIQKGARQRIYDKQRMARAEAQAIQERAERVQAVLTSDLKPQNEYRTFKALDEAAERALETTNKAPIAKRTVEKLMQSHTLAAGVAAGGLGLIYAANRLRAEREVGR